MNTIGNYAPDFEIPGIDQEVYHLGSYRRKFEAIAVIFISDLPEVAQYIERLKKIQDEFGSQKFTIIGIDSNYRSEPIAQSMEAMQKYAAEQQLNFPFLRDSTQDVAKSFQVKVLPTVYLLDSDGVIRYQGRIDDGGEVGEQIKHHYLRDCVEAMLSNKTIERDYITPEGTEIQWRPK